MRGDSESASKNTSKPIFKHPKYSNIRIFENSLASDLVFVPRATVKDEKSRACKGHAQDKMEISSTSKCPISDKTYFVQKIEVFFLEIENTTTSLVL